MKRTPLKRKKPMKPGSRTRTTKSRSKPRRSGRVRDEQYLKMVRLLPCVIVNEPCFEFMRCSTGVEAHHAGKRPMGRKCSDYETIPLCTYHHRHITDHTGPFRDWDRDARRRWHDARIAETQAALGYTKESR